RDWSSDVCSSDHDPGQPVFEDDLCNLTFHAHPCLSLVDIVIDVIDGKAFIVLKNKSRDQAIHILEELDHHMEFIFVLHKHICGYGASAVRDEAAEEAEAL